MFVFDISLSSETWYMSLQPDPPPNSFTFNYGDVPADKTSVTATKYTQGFSFAADPTTSIDAQTAYLVARNGQKKRLGTLVRQLARYPDSVPTALGLR